MLTSINLINTAARLIVQRISQRAAATHDTTEPPFVIRDVRAESREMETLSVDTNITTNNPVSNSTVIQAITEDEVEQRASSLAIPEGAQASAPNHPDTLETEAFQILPEVPFLPLIEELQEENNSLKMQVSELKSSLTDHKNTLDEMEKGIANAKNSLMESLDANAENEVQIQILRFEKEELLSDNKLKKEQIQELNQAVTGLITESENQKASIEELSAALSINANTISDLRLKIDKQQKDSEQKTTHLKLKNQQLKDTLAIKSIEEASNKKIATQEDLIAEKECLIYNLIHEKQKLIQEVESAGEQLDIINKEHKKEVDDLKRQLLEATSARALSIDEASTSQGHSSSSES